MRPDLYDFGLLCEMLAFQMHLCNRHAFGILGDKRRTAFIGALEEVVQLSLRIIAEWFWGVNDEKQVTQTLAWWIGLYTARELEYADTVSAERCIEVYSMRVARRVFSEPSLTFATEVVIPASEVEAGLRWKEKLRGVT